MDVIRYADAKGPLVVHVPHAGTYIPAFCRASYLGDTDNEQDLLCDRFADILFDLSRTMIVFQESRIFCDVERFADDEKEEMALKGMGMCYVRRVDGKALRTLHSEDRIRIKHDYYDVHHDLLSSLVAEKLAYCGSCLIVDAHTFSSVPLAHESDRAYPRADFCIGSDPFHTPPSVVDALCDYFSKRGYSVRVNSPFSGALVPLAFYQRDERVHSVMIEVNRALYLDGDIASIHSLLSGAITLLEGLEA